MKKVFLSLALVCCSSKNHDPVPVDLGGSTGQSHGGSAPIEEVCATGDKRPCHITLGEHGGVTSCFVGVQFCVEGTWSQCGSDPGK
jgi:hypothetical protein